MDNEDLSKANQIHDIAKLLCDTIEATMGFPAAVAWGYDPLDGGVVTGSHISTSFANDDSLERLGFWFGIEMGDQIAWRMDPDDSINLDLEDE